MLATSCGRTPSDHITTTIYSPSFARCYKIVATSTDTLLQITNPFQGNGTDVSRLSLHHPARRVVCMSSSHVAFLDRLGLADRVVGVSGLNYISTPHIDRTRVADIGYDANLNYELIASLNPDVVLMYGISGENTSVTAKLTELGIPYIYIGDYTEITPLGKAEWLVAFGYMCGVAEQSVRQFDSIRHRYDSLRQLVGGCATRPTVMLNAPYRDVWFVPSDSSYMVSLLGDAGAVYACSGDTSRISRPISIEAAYTTALKADFWLNPNQARSIASLLDENPRFGEVKSVTEGAVFNCTARSNAAGGSDFWESGVVNADIVLQDLIRIFHPETSTGELYYYEHLQ